MFPFSIPWTQRELQRDRFAMARTLPWSHDLDLEPDVLDPEHQYILDRINNLLRVLSSRDACRISMACNLLSAGAREHFAHEEQRMRDAGFPGVVEHADQHVELARRLAEVRLSMFSPYGISSQLGALPFLERWLVPHLRLSDRQFADFLATLNVATRVEPPVPQTTPEDADALHEGS
jgi:hemerythrin-like metal-binding protein